jgi:hypothetical protein
MAVTRRDNVPAVPAGLEPSAITQIAKRRAQGDAARLLNRLAALCCAIAFKNSRGKKKWKYMVLIFLSIFNFDLRKLHDPFRSC